MLKFRNFSLAGPGSSALIICLLLLNALSLSAVYSGLHREGKLAESAVLYRQIAWIILSWIFLFLFSFTNYRFYYYLGHYFYAVTLMLLAAVFFFGKSAMGAQRWISVWGLTFQPSELSKVAVIIILARHFAAAEEKSALKHFLSALFLVMLIALIIFKQPDLGTALVIIFLFFMVGISSRIPKVYFIGLIALGLIFAPLAFKSLKDYQKKRLAVFINPDADPLGSGYTIIQSKIAIGSGGVWGKGFLAGTQNQFNFLPERHTDFIFTVIAEEWGLLGSLGLLLIYWLMLKNIFQKIITLSDPFAYFLALGIVSLFFLHVFVNIGMALGILPVVGLPLIFLSYGGTNLLISFILMGIFFNIHRQQR